MYENKIKHATQLLLIKLDLVRILCKRLELYQYMDLKWNNNSHLSLISKCKIVKLKNLLQKYMKFAILIRWRAIKWVDPT